MNTSYSEEQKFTQTHTEEIQTCVNELKHIKHKALTEYVQVLQILKESHQFLDCAREREKQLCLVLRNVNEAERKYKRIRPVILASSSVGKQEATTTTTTTTSREFSSSSSKKKRKTISS
jgi:hypothetical protein